MNNLQPVHRLGHSRGTVTQLQRRLREQNREFGKEMVPVPLPDHLKSIGACPPVKVWRSRDFLAQLFHEPGGVRLTVNRTEIDQTGDWKAGLTWDDLMWVKGQCGLGDVWAVEVFPPEAQVINETNMRHLWILKEAPAFGWVVRAESVGFGVDL